MKQETIKLIKSDAPHCIAELKCVRVIAENHAGDLYMGKVRFYDKGIALYNLPTDIVRLSIVDALLDARELARENGFTD